MKKLFCGIILAIGLSGPALATSSSIWGAAHGSTAVTNRLPTDLSSTSTPHYNTIGDILSAMSGDCTTDPSTGIVTCPQIDGLATRFTPTGQYSQFIFTEHDGYANGQPDISRTIPLYDASTGAAPSFTTAKKRSIAVVSVAGTINGTPVTRGDLIMARQDNPTSLTQWDVIQDSSTAFCTAAVAAQGAFLDLEGTYLIDSANCDVKISLTGNFRIFNRFNLPFLYQTVNDTYAAANTVQSQVSAIAKANYSEPNTGQNVQRVTRFTMTNPGDESNYTIGQQMAVTTNAATPDTGVTSSKNFIREGFKIIAIDTTSHYIFANRVLSWHYKMATVTKTATTIAFTHGSPDTITDSGNGFITAGYDAGDTIVVSGSSHSENNATRTITKVAAGTLTLSVSNTQTAASAGDTITITRAPLMYLNSVNTDRAITITGNGSVGGAPSYLGESVGWWQTMRGDEVSGTLSGSTSIARTAHHFNVGDPLQIGTTPGGETTTVTVATVPDADHFTITIPSTQDYSGSAPGLGTSGTVYYQPEFAITDAAHHGSAVVAESASGSDITLKVDRAWAAGLFLRNVTDYSKVKLECLNDQDILTNNNNTSGRLTYCAEMRGSENEASVHGRNWGRHDLTTSNSSTVSPFSAASWYTAAYGGAVNLRGAVRSDAGDGGAADTHPASIGTNMDSDVHYPSRSVFESSYQGNGGNMRGSCEVRKHRQIGGYEGLVLRSISLERALGCIEQVDIEVSDLPFANNNQMGFRTEANTDTNTPIVVGRMAFKNAGASAKFFTGNTARLTEYSSRDVAYSGVYLTGTTNFEADTMNLSYASNSSAQTTRYGVLMENTATFTANVLNFNMGAANNPTEIFKDNDNLSGKTVTVNEINITDPNGIGMPLIVTSGRDSNFTLKIGTVIYNGVVKSINKGYVAVTGTYSILPSDYIVNATSGTFTATLPTAVGRQGKEYTIKNSGAGTVTVATTSAQTIDGSGTDALTSNQSINVNSDGANWIIH